MGAEIYNLQENKLVKNNNGIVWYALTSRNAKKTVQNVPRENNHLVKVILKHQHVHLVKVVLKHQNVHSYLKIESSGKNTLQIPVTRLQLSVSHPGNVYTVLQQLTMYFW
jgi:hypothetical protein